MKLSFRVLDSGFTLVELLLVMGLFAILVGLSTTNFLSFQHRTTLTAGTETLLSDIKSQQTKAMVGLAPNGSSDNFGILLSQNQYILFRGSTYSSSDSSNFVVALPSNIQIKSIIFPNSQIIFSKGSGEIAGFSGSQNTFVIQNLSGNEQKTVVVNRYGVITSVK